MFCVVFEQRLQEELEELSKAKANARERGNGSRHGSGSWDAHGDGGWAGGRLLWRFVTAEGSRSSLARKSTIPMCIRRLEMS